MLHNDWIVANIQNPEYTTGMFSASGLDTENTQMLKESEYLKSNFITKNPYFADSNGNFDKDKFHAFYTESASGWKQLQDKKNIEHVYDFFDPEAPIDAKKTNPLTGSTYDLQAQKKKPFGDFLKITSYNSEVGSIGLSGVNDIAAPTKSVREEAQRQNIFDFSDKKFIEGTPDDQALFSNPFKFVKSLFSDPLVLATYDKDTIEIDKFTGEKVKHKKGDIKLNDNGKPYYETLAGRSPYSKQVLSTFDNLTTEDSALNKYDFFDSDDLEKSVAGSIAKNLMGVVPMLFGGEVAAVYSGALVARELAKTAPMVWGMVHSLWSNESAHNSVLNGIEAKMTQITGSSSDHANANMGFTWETVFNLMGDVALQWGQQQQVAGWTRRLLGGKKDFTEAIQTEAKAAYDKKLASIFSEATTDAKKSEALINFGFEESYIANLLKTGGKDATDAWKMTSIGQAALKKSSLAMEPKIEKLNRLGANSALAYMALVSNTEVYHSALENGASAREAAALAMGATLGMYTVDRMGIGEMFFDELEKQSAREINSAIMSNSKEWMSTLLKKSENELTDANKFKKLIIGGRNKVAKLLSDYADDVRYHTTGAVGKAIGEGLEEVSEDVVVDIANSTYALLHELGWAQSKDIMGFGYNKDLNDGKGGYDIKSLLAKYGMSFTGGTLGGGLFYGVNVAKSGTFHAPQNSADMLYLINQGKAQDILDRIEHQRIRGAFGSTTISAQNSVKDASGNDVKLTIDSDLSVNDYIAKQLTNQVKSYQAIMDDNNLNMSEDQLFDHMIMQDKIFRGLSAYLKNDSYITRYQQSWLGLANDVLIAQKGLEVAAAARNGEIPKEILTQLGSSKSSRQLIEELGEARLTDKEGRHNPAEETKRNMMVSSWQNYLKDRKEALSQFESPENSSYYTEMLMFGLDDNLSASFGLYNFSNWLFYNHGGLTEDKLTGEQLTQYKADYESYLKTKKPLDLQQAFSNYKHFQKLVDPELQNIAAVAKNFEAFQGKLDDIVKTPTWWLRLSNTKARQEWETLDEFNEATTQKEGESDAEFAVRLNDRQIKIENEKTKKLQEVLNFVRTSNLDPLTARQLKIAFGQSAKSIKTETVMNEVARQTKANALLWGLIGKPLSEYKGEETADLKTTLTNSILKHFSDISDLLFPVKYGNYGQVSSLFGSNKEGFGEVVKNYLFTKADTTKIPEKYTKNYTNTEEALTKLFNEADEGLYRIEESTKQTYAQIFKEVFGEDELTRLQNSIISETYTDDEGDDITIDSLDPIKWLGENALDTLNTLSTKNSATNYLTEILSNTSQEATYKSTKDNLINTLQAQVDGAIASGEIALKNKQEYQILSNINVEIKNPMTELMKKLPLYDSNIEQLLNKLQDQFDQGIDPTEFIIDPADEAYIPQALQVLNLASSYIQAASSDQNLSTIYGHNKTLNRFNKEHGVQVDPLAEIDENYANMYQIELQKYKDALDSDKWSLPYISKKNLGNSLLLFEQSKKALLNVHKAFWDSIKNAFTIEGKNILEKYVPTGDAEEDVRQASNLFYDAIQANPKALNEILKQFTNNIPQQGTANINPKLTEAGFSNYDKAVYLITTAGLQYDTALQAAKDFTQNHPSIVPLDSQFQIAKLGMAMVNNPKLIRDAIHTLAETSSIKLPVLDSTIFIPGIGGSGKTSVVAKMIAEYAKDKKLYMAAPGETQAKNLEQSLGQSGALTAQQLMALVTDDTSIKNTIDGYKQVEEFKNLNESADKITLKDAEPGVLIIDEYTHFDTLTDLVLDKWAKKNGIIIIGFGDNSQKGYVNPNALICGNDADTMFMLRSSRLAVSLRNGNVQQVDSTQQLDNITQHIYNNAFNINPESARNTYNLLQSWKPRYYNQDKFYGTYIGNNFNDWSKVFGDVTPNADKPPVAFIGSDTAFNKLNAPTNTVQRFSNIKDVQGSEFDYIIYEGDIAKIPTMLNNSAEAMGNALIFARDLYTVVSRGKKGSIIITDNSSFTNRQDISTAKTTDLAAKAAEEQKKFLEKLNGLTLNPATSSNTGNNNTSNIAPASSSTNQTVSPDEVVAATSGVLLSADPEHTVKEDTKTTENDKVLPNIEGKDRIYSNFSLLGVPRTDKGYWEIPGESSTSFRDIGVIANVLNIANKINGHPVITEVTDGRTKNELTTQLLLLKDSLLRIKTPSGNIKSYDDFLAGMMTSNRDYIISREAYNSLKYQVHIRPKEATDKLVGYSKLDDKQMEINIDGKKYLAVVEATWNEGNVTNTITLGSLASFVTYKKAVDDAKGTAYGDTLANNYNKYTNAIRDILYKEHGVREIKAPDNVITELKNIGDPIPFALIPKVTYDEDGKEQFHSNEGDYNPDAGDSIPELLRLPYSSISAPLTFFKGLPGVSEKLDGRTVYLVSAKPGLSTKQLVDAYYEQKFAVARGEEVMNKLDVRMIVPTERGMSFTGMANAIWRDRFTLPSDKTHLTAVNFPADSGILGMKLFAQAWNTRANAMMVKAEMEGNTNIEAVNKSLSHGAQQFRLLPEDHVSSRTKNPTFYRIGWDTYELQDEYNYWLGLQGKPSQAWIADAATKPADQKAFENYQKGLPDKDPHKLKNYIYITPKYLDHLIDITNALLEPFNDFIQLQANKHSLIDIKTLYKDCLNQSITDSEILFPIAGSKDKIRVKFDKDAVEYESQLVKEEKTLQATNFFKVIPLFFTKGYKFALLGSESLKDKPKNRQKLRNITHYIKYKLYSTRTDPATGNKVTIGTKGTYKTFNEQPLIEAAKAINNNTEFSNIFNLIFHGTSDPTGNVSGKNNFRESSAYFKNGIYYYPYCDTGSDDTRYMYADTKQGWFRRLRGDEKNISAFYQTNVIPISIADFDISPKTTTETVSTEVSKISTDPRIIEILEERGLDATGDVELDIKTYMTNQSIQQQIALGNYPIYLYNKDTNKIQEFTPEKSTVSLGVSSKNGSTHPVIQLERNDYKALTGESIEDSIVSVYIDDEGNIARVSEQSTKEDSNFDNITFQQVKEEFNSQADSFEGAFEEEDKIQVFLEDNPDITVDEVKELWGKLKNPKDAKEFVNVLYSLKDKCFGEESSFLEGAETLQALELLENEEALTLAQKLDNILDAYDKDGNKNAENACKIIFEK